MTEAARLVDELTTLLYEVTTGWQDSAGGHQIVRCGACRRKADRAESVVHESDCPVYRLIRAEEANTAVIRANAEEIADLEDKRDELEAQVNALTALLAERDAEVARLAAAEATMDSPTWPYVLAFARQMEGKLDQNRHKGNREGWLKDAPIDLLARLVEEVVELQHAIDRGWPTDDVAGEAADVANFALMVADAYRHRNGSRAALAGSRERAQGEEANDGVD